MSRGIAAWFSIVLSLAGLACVDTSGRATLTDRNISEFTVVALPVLLRDCGFQACHGSQERIFRIYGQGRARLDPATEPLDELTGLEQQLSLQYAEGMVDPVDPKQSLLLLKPLAVEAGGMGHEGVDKYGRDVYRAPDDDGFLTLQRWIISYAPQMAAAQ